METRSTRQFNTAEMLNNSLILLSIATSSQAAVVINEVDYDQPGSDTAEFIELFNAGTKPASLEAFTLELVNGSSGSTYNSFDLAGLAITAGGYLVLCNSASTVVNCNIEVASSGWIQNGGSDGDAIALLSAGTIVDTIAYEAIGNLPDSYTEGNSFAVADSNRINMSIARLPNGFDSNNNSSDFNSACITPGSSNISGTGDCSISVNPVPIPAAVWLFGSGLVGMISIGRRKKTA